MKFLLSISPIFVLSIAVFAKVTDQAQAEKILQKYNQKSGVQIKLEVVTEKKVLGTKTVETGTVIHQLGKMNLSLQGDKKTEMIFDGKKAYLISYPDQELDPDGTRKVFVLSSADKNQMSMLSSMFGNPKKFFSGFVAKTVKSTNDSLVLKLEDKKASLKPMTLAFSKKEQQLSQISYLDDVGSETQIKFAKPSFNTEISANLFKYKPLKADEVTKQ